jgi:1L-myo-inositol 1-phosphate cytidylyltransferase / CDP-L-myo-inositol myo-inositolphosphotransferase
VPRFGVVLAAGRSERLSPITGGRSKALMLLGGMTLLERAVRALQAGGIRDVLVVAGYEAELVELAVEGMDGVRVVRAADWELGNGASLAAVEPDLRDEPLFAVLCGDHVFAGGALDGLLRAGQPAVLIDPSPDPDAWSEGTRVRVEAGVVRGFGKHLPEPGIDCGAFLLGPELFDAHRRAAAEADHSLAGAATEMTHGRTIRAVPIPPEAWWQDVDTPNDLLRARGLVRRSLAKSTDGPVSRHVNRPVSTRITMALAPLRIHPDLLSLLFFVVGMWAAWSLSAGRAVVGGLLVQAASVLDGVDGETARLRGIASPRGAMLDSVLDRMVDAAVVAGLGLWIWTDPSRLFRAMIITLASVGWAALALGAKETWPAIPALERPPDIERRLGLLLGGRDGRSLVIAACAVASRPWISVIGAAISWSGTVIVRTILLIRRRGPAVVGVGPDTDPPKAAAPDEEGQPSQRDLEEIG